MKTVPQKVVTLTMLLILIFVIFSCNKDSNLLLDAVLSDPEISLEEKETAEDGLVTRTFTFSPTNDAYLQNEQGYDQSVIRLEEDYRTSYLMFDLSEVNGTITHAVLQFSIDSDEGDGSIAIHKGKTTDWTEESLTINNAPALDMQLASINKAYTVGAPEKVVLNVDNLSSESTTLVMTHSTGNDLAFASKEHPADKGPKLEITYQAPKGSPPISPKEDESNDDDTSQDNDDQNDTTQNEDTNQDDQSDNDTTTTAATDGAYYVTTSGSPTNNGLSEATAWSIEHAFETALAGDVVYIKAGDYGNKQLIADNSGTASSPIKFIGYTNTPGDLTSHEGSTFNYGDNLDSNKMPLLRGSNSSENTAIEIPESFIQIENFQITNYRLGLRSTGQDLVIRNIIGTNFGNQANYNAYDGFGIHILGDRTLLENSFVYNATAEAIKLFDSDYSIVNFCSVFADNAANPTDYYFLLTGGTNNSIVENSYAQREQGLRHGGHGFDMKDLAENNIFKNCTAVRTSFELNFSGVKNNTITDCFIYGVDTNASNWHAGIVIFNGANKNLIKNLHIENTWTAISWADYDDGYVGPNGDRDEVSMGYDNIFENITIKNTNRVLNVGGGNNFNAWARRNTLKNCSISNFEFVAVTYYPTEDIKFENCSFNGGKNFVVETKNQYAAYSSFDVSWINCSWNNINFSPPN